MVEYSRQNIISVAGARLGADTVDVHTDVEEHTHDYVEAAFVLRGKGEHRASSGSDLVARGAVALIRPGSWHSYHCIEPMVIANLYLAPELFHRELAWILDYPRLASGLLRAGQALATVDDSAIQRIADWLVQLAEVRDVRRAPTALGLASCVLGELIDADFVASTRPAESISEYVRQAMTLCSTAIGHRWTVAELAGLVCVSPSHLQRRFREEVGISLITWLTQLRGEKAASLLAQSDLPISDIARQVGWIDPNYASRRFRSIYDVTPSEYRRRFGAASPS